MKTPLISHRPVRRGICRCDQSYILTAKREVRCHGSRRPGKVVPEKEMWPKTATGGRNPNIDTDEVRSLKSGGMGATAIAKKLGTGRASVYRVLVDTA